MNKHGVMFKRTVIALAAMCIAGSPLARKMVDPDEPPPAQIYKAPIVFDNGRVKITVPSGEYNASGVWESYDTAGLGADIVDWALGGMNDKGDWYCPGCLVPTSAADAFARAGEAEASWAEFITTVVNRTIWPQKRDGEGAYIGQWRSGDVIALCDGKGNCVVLTWGIGKGTLAWQPNPLKPDKVWKTDKHMVDKKYMNVPSGASTTPRVGSNVTPVYGGSNAGNGNNELLTTLINVDPRVRSVIVEPNEIPPDGGPRVPEEPDLCCGFSIMIPVPDGMTPEQAAAQMPTYNFDTGNWESSGSGGGCVHIDSILPDGRRAGDIKVGDTMHLGDEYSVDLASAVGVVSYSQEKTMQGFRVTTSDGISLVCSDTAPLWTDEGYVLAPHVLGKRVATRVDSSTGGIETNFRVVETVEALGPIQIQHITVGNRAFWAGEEKGAYILHHNLKAMISSPGGAGGIVFDPDQP